MSWECGCVPGHRFTEPQGSCADCGLTEMDVAEGKARPCVPFRTATEQAEIDARRWESVGDRRVRSHHMSGPAIDIVPRWGDPGSDPLADLQRWRKVMLESTGYAPNRITMPLSRWNRMERLVMRHKLSKRAYRRWRGRRKAARRWARTEVKRVLAQ
jgi:hypothetical protein